MARYRLLPVLRFDGLWKGEIFEVGGRTKWNASLHVSRLSSGASVTVVLETSPTEEEQDFSTWKTFGAISVVGTTDLIPSKDLSLTTPRDVYMRANITAITGEAVCECMISSPFVDVTADDGLALLPQELREWKDGRDRIVERAERDVVGMILRNPETGDLDVDLTLPDAHDLIQREIALQAGHLHRRALLERSHEPSAMVTLREMTLLVPGMGRGLRKVRHMRQTIWRGR